MRAENHRRQVLQVCVSSGDIQDVGVGTVVGVNPTTIIVPSHLLVLLEEDGYSLIQVDGISVAEWEILELPSLESDHLAALRLPSTRIGRLSPLRLKNCQPKFAIGDSVQMIAVSEEGTRTQVGHITHVERIGPSTTIFTDIRISKGESGSALFSNGAFIGVVQGRANPSRGGGAIGVALANEAIRSLRRIAGRRLKRRLLTIVPLTIVLAALGFALAFRTFNSFSVSGIELLGDGYTVLAHNSNKLSMQQRWAFTSTTPIRRYRAVSLFGSSSYDHVAVGTMYRDGFNGEFILLDRTGNVLWTYSVPDGECVYSSEGRPYNGFNVDRIYAEDMDGDGLGELLVVFVHDNAFPCKLVILDSMGGVLAEYWHPGYIRTIAVGSVGPDSQIPLIVASASNNALPAAAGHAQTLFAFAGLRVGGQGPPYQGGDPERESESHGTEVWYMRIRDVSPEELRAKCTKIDIGDFDGDGDAEIQADLSDGRFYYIDSTGQELWAVSGDQWSSRFQGHPIPALEPIRLRTTEH